MGGASDEQNDWTRRLQLMSIGAGSGFLAGLFGVGGGAVTIPALTMCLEMSHYQALGTSLAAMVPTALVGTHSHHAQGHVVWSFVAPLAVGSLCGSFLGGKEIAMQIPENYLKWGFGIMMVVLGSKTIYSAGPLKSMALSASKAK
uniref:Membrane transporter protein n=2 Tax=Nannochloropsis gaditana TaxID=72520 RepID=I2CRK5_NANGC